MANFCGINPSPKVKWEMTECGKRWAPLAQPRKQQPQGGYRPGTVHVFI